MICEFKIKLDKLSGIGKNNYGVSRNGIHYPKKSFVEFRNNVLRQILQQKKTDFTTINYPVKIILWFNPPDKRKRDATAILDAIFHCLEKARIIEDDNYIKRIDYQEVHFQDNCIFYIRLENFL